MFILYLKSETKSGKLGKCGMWTKLMMSSAKKFARAISLLMQYRGAIQRRSLTESKVSKAIDNQYFPNDGSQILWKRSYDGCN
jgi:hypothetical protein